MNKVKTGQKFSVKAETWNSFIDAADFVKQQQADMNNSVSRKDTKSGVVMVRNGTDNVLEQFNVVSLGDLIIKPVDNEQEFRCNLPVFEAENVSDENKEKPFAILQKPLMESECGLAMVTGITPVKINIGSAAHEFVELSADGLNSSETGSIRVLWKDDGTGDKWAVVQLGSSAAVAAEKSYDGPFAVVQKDDTTVTMYGYNEEEGRDFHDYVNLGSKAVEVAETEISASESGYVYVKVTIASDEYDHEVKYGALEDNSDTQLIIPIAFVQFLSNDDGPYISTIYQYVTTGNYVVQGRIL
jgi:hypothetical protein